MTISRFNMTMLTDFYELTMANGYLEAGIPDTITYFDMFFRKTPDNAGFAIVAGLEQLVENLSNLKFTEEDIVFLRSKTFFSERFLDYLRNFKFTCDVWAIPEGTPVFPNEPLITVKGPVIQAQFIETLLLLTINHQSLIATKSNRIVRAARGKLVMEYGTRRAQGGDGAIYGARAAYLAGCMGTACVVAGRDHGVPVLGTMAHSWVQMFDTEYDAFLRYANIFPDNCTLLVDTYNVLKSGVPNAIKVFDKLDLKKKAIRIDSGDMTYLSKKARIMLDNAGHKDCKIVASNSFDEYLIRDVLLQGAKIDIFGVGERLITSRSEPVFGGVYKLAALERDGKIIPKIKISENVEKITNPGVKCLYRFYDKTSGKAIADVIALQEEVIDKSKEYVIFNPDATWKKKVISNFEIRKLHEKIFEGGKLIYKLPTLEKVKKYCKEQVDTLWDEILRFENPHEYYVDLSENLWQMKQTLISENSK